jgi:hypothetical protein
MRGFIRLICEAKKQEKFVSCKEAKVQRRKDVLGSYFTCLPPGRFAL